MLPVLTCFLFISVYVSDRGVELETFATLNIDPVGYIVLEENEEFLIIKEELFIDIFMTVKILQKL